MAVVNIQSALITNMNASPPVQNAVSIEGGRKRSTVGFVTVTNGDSIASTYRIARIMSHWRLQTLRMFNNAITSGAANIGLYRTVADGGALVLASPYGAAIAIATANLAGTELLFANRTLDQIGASVWQDAGLTADPRLAYDLVVTLTAAATATGILAFELGFCVD